LPPQSTLFPYTTLFRSSVLDGGSEIIYADDIVIATGSSPYRPADVDFTHARIYDSDTILDMAHTPRHIIIYGAGVIGCEYASIRSEEHTSELQSRENLV